MKIRIVYLAVVLCLFGTITPVETAPFEGTQRGAPAIQLALRSLSSGKSILTVSLRPGDEDLGLMAYLRFARGADLTSLYITNGEAIPSDCDAEASPFLIGRRKEEADRAMKALGASAFFINNSDPGVVNSRADVQSSWRSYSVRRLAAAIRFLHPHVIIVMSSRQKKPAGAVMDEVVSRLVKEAVSSASKPVSVATADDYGSNAAWNVQRIWTRGADGVAGFHPDRGANDPALGMRYLSLAGVAASAYESLRDQMDGLRDDSSSVYVATWPDRPRNLRTPETGVEIVSPRFSSLQRFVEKIGTIRPDQKSLLISRCVQGIDSLDRILGTQLARVNELDKHTLVRWKTLLERLRFLALDVKLEISVSDSIIAQRQLFYVDVRKTDPSSQRGNTTIYFSPNVTNDWYVNEKSTLTLPLKGPERFRILSAQQLDLNYPVFRYGLASPTLTVPFSYGVYYYDQDRTRRYVANFQAPVRYTRTRIIEMATPMILWGVDREIPYRAFNASRDSSKGIFTVSGANCTSKAETVFVRKKDESLAGSIKIAWSGEPPKGLDTLEVRASGRLFAKVLVKNLPLKRDTTRKILLVSRSTRGATAIALRRIYPSAGIVSPSQLQTLDLNAVNVIVIDRRAFDQQTSADRFSASVMPWMQQGGNLVMLPQNADIAFDSTKFSWGYSYSPSVPVKLTGGTANSLNTPNELSEKTWLEWAHARAWCAVQTASLKPSDIAITTKQDGRPLVWVKPVAKGSIIYVSLNLEQQMENLHDGAFQLFSNLLCFGHGEMQ